MTDIKASTTGSGHKILAVVTVDIMAWKLLRPWFLALQKDGHEVHIACARTEWFEQLAADGFRMHDVPLRRRVNPFLHLAPLWVLYRLMRRERFALVNTHSPVASVVGRIAAWLARIPAIVYTVHGFYFHDDMPRLQRRSLITLEQLLGRITTGFMFVSEEDRQTAAREGISSFARKTLTIYNGVDLNEFSPRVPGTSELRNKLEIPQDAMVVGIVGRVVKEKGYMEFAGMARMVSAGRNGVCFLVVGDALTSDRDGMVAELRSLVEAAGLQDRFRFTGFTNQVADYLRIMDIFVLPSYREGFPRSVLEAMSCSLPVIATNIRGCREAVVPGETGLLVPSKSAPALAGAVAKLLENPVIAISMGSAGRERAVRLYDERLVARKFTDFINDNYGRSGNGQTHF